MKKMLLVLVLAVLAAVPAVQAWQPAPSQPGAQEDYVPASSLPQVERLPAAPLLIAAYAFVWVALLAYVWTLWRRLLTLEREMKALGRRVPKA